MNLNKFLQFACLAGLALTLHSCAKDGKESTQAVLLIPPSGVIPDEYIIMLKSDLMTGYRPSGIASSREESAALAAEKLAYMQERVQPVLAGSGIESTQINSYYSEIFYGFSAHLTKSQLQSLLLNPFVKQIEQDMEVHLPDFTIEPGPQGLRAQTIPCGILNARGPGNGTGPSTWIWIVDTGIDLDHPDLNVETNSAYAKSFVKGSSNPDDCHGHGTHCAGIAAAIDNGIGVVGVSAGARVVPVRVLNCRGSGTTSAILNGLNHIAANDQSGDVINMSLGGYWGSNCDNGSSYSATLRELGNSGTRISLAAGNSSANATLYAPACVNGTNIHTVASMTCTFGWSSFSNFGIPPVDWIATGSSVYSTYKKGGYATLSGTSMAAPHVAGILHQQATPSTNGTVTHSSVTYKVAALQ